MFSGHHCLQECVSEFSPGELAEIQQACVFDMCHMNNDIVLALCPTAEQFALRCQQDFHVDITSWRGKDFCRTFCIDCMSGCMYNSPCKFKILTT